MPFSFKTTKFPNMASSSFLVSSILFFFFFFFFISSSSIVEATVSPSNTFKYVNEGDIGGYIAEYGDYRVLPLPLQTFPFAFCFYNTTPNAFTLGLRMGHHRSESIMRWVWDANRGSPVKDNATLSFGRDGNLVLADPDGKVAWQTGTANKGVTGLKLLSNGNLVLLDRRGGFVWQSFDHPTDTLLVGQSLRPSGPSKLVSRVSDMDGSEGAYTYILEKNRFALYQKTKNSLKPLLYYTPDQSLSFPDNSHVTFDIESVNDGFATELKYNFGVGNSSNGGSWTLTRPKYNATLSMFRLESDGNMRMYTYNDKVDWGAWDVTFTLFSRDDRAWQVSECKLPTRCGSLGVCEDNQCVACPTAKGLLGWSKDCAPPKRNGCGVVGKAVNYYKVVGVEHSMVSEGDGPMKVGLCKEKCDKDCGCLGFFYREESSKCLLAPELGTLSKVSNSSHVAYIKM